MPWTIPWPGSRKPQTRAGVRIRMTHYSWETTFLDLFDRTLERFRAGRFHWQRDFLGGELDFLRSIGYQPREFFDFVEDYAGDGEPSPSSALLVAAVRRDYFYTVQKGVSSTRRIPPSGLPSRQAELGGIPWLPRIIAKAEAKLRGELDPDIMYGCGGDRAFLRQQDVHPADFLRMVWASRGDSKKVLLDLGAPRAV